MCVFPWCHLDLLGYFKFHWCSHKKFSWELFRSLTILRSSEMASSVREYPSVKWNCGIYEVLSFSCWAILCLKLHGNCTVISIEIDCLVLSFGESFHSSFSWICLFNLDNFPLWETWSVKSRIEDGERKSVVWLFWWTKRLKCLRLIITLSYPRLCWANSLHLVYSGYSVDSGNPLSLSRIKRNSSERQEKQKKHSKNLVPPRIELRSREPESPILTFILWNLTLADFKFNILVSLNFPRQNIPMNLTTPFCFSYSFFILYVANAVPQESLSQ